MEKGCLRVSPTGTDVTGKVFRSERAALSREVAGRAPGGDQLQLGEGVAARGGDGGQGAQARGASPAAPAASAARHAAAHRRQRASLVSRRALVRLAGHYGRRQQRDLLRAVGGRGSDGSGADGAERSGRNTSPD